MIASRPSAVLLLIPLLALMGIAGCGGDKTKPPKDNIDPPTELADLVAPRTVQKLWKTSVGEGARLPGGRLAPAVVDGLVFVGNLDGTLQALDAQSGKLQWKVETGQRLSGGPGAGNGIVAVGTLDGLLLTYSYDGSPRWEAPVSSEIVAAPAVGQGLVVVMSNDGRSFAFDADSGTRRWVVDSAVPALSLRGTSTPLISEALTFIGQANGKISAIDNVKGETVWEQAIGEPGGRTELERMVDLDGRMLLIQGDLFVVGYASRAQALAGESGRVLWSRDMSSYTGLDLAGRSLVVTTSIGEVLNLDVRSGSALWKQEALRYRFLSTPVVQGETLVVGDYDGYLHWIDLESGEIVARVNMGGKGIRSAPVVADGVVYALDLDGSLGAFRLGGG